MCHLLKLAQIMLIVVGVEYPNLNRLFMLVGAEELKNTI